MAKKNPQRPRRTPEHVIASQSQNYLEKFFIDKGHTATPLLHDYGTDLLVETFDKNGYAENGYIRLQVRARSKLKYSADGTAILFAIEAKHYHLWIDEDYPFFLMLYDARNVAAYYLYIQQYFAHGTKRKPKKTAKKVAVRVPVENIFTEDTVDYMRGLKAAIQEQIKGKVKHD